MGLAGLALTSLTVGWLWRARFATLRVVHTRPEAAWLQVDGGRPVLLTPVSTETPDAGVTLSLAPGSHRLVVTSLTGEELEAIDVNLPARSSSLFAPAPDDQCFWVEHTAYGRALPTRPPLRLLPPEQRVWGVPDEVDAWFFATPAPVDADHRSSGGTRTAIRQARCGFEPWR